MFEDNQLRGRAGSDYKREKIHRVKNKINWTDINWQLKKIDMRPGYTREAYEKKYLKQANLLLNLEDEYKRIEIRAERNPIYANLNHSQLRSYIAWRTKARKGIIEPTEETYIRLYAAEVINNLGIGVNDGFVMLFLLLGLVCDHRDKYYLTEDLTRWIKDYYLVYSPKMTIAEAAVMTNTTYNFPAFVPDKVNLIQFEAIAEDASYRYRESRYWSEENEAFVKKCFLETMANLGPLMKIYNISITDLFYGEYCIDYDYLVFNGALFVNEPRFQKEVVLNDYEMFISNEKYGYSTNGVVHIRQNPESNVFYVFFGAVIKEIELVFRELTGKNPLKSIMDKSIGQFMKCITPYKRFYTLLLDPLFVQIIHETVECNYTGDDKKIKKTVQATLKNMNEEPYLTFRKLREFTKYRFFNRDREFLYYAKIAKDLKVYHTDILPYDFSLLPYNDMTNQQMLTYFGFRTNFEDYNMYYVPKFYLRLYCSELVNNLRFNDKYETIKRLVDLLFLYEDKDDEQTELLVGWIKDYFAYNHFPCTFREIIEKHNLARFYPEICVSEDIKPDLINYNFISGYNILKSKIYKGDNDELVDECFSYIIPKIKEEIEEIGEDFYRLACGRKKDLYGLGIFDTLWNVYSNKAEGTVYVSKFDEYYGIECYMSVRTAIDRKYKTPKNFVGYIIKEMDSVMREILGFKSKLSADYNKLLPKRFQDSYEFYHFVEDGKLKEAVDRAVVEFFKIYHNDIYRESKLYESEPVVVNVDTKKLQQIREEAEETKEKLIVDEEPEVVENEKKETPENASAPKNNDNNPWSGLISSLSDSEKTAIGILLGRNATPIGEFAKSKNLLLEVLVEGINEKAIEFIGDNLIDSEQNTPVIYDDYINELKEAWEEF